MSITIFNSLFKYQPTIRQQALDLHRMVIVSTQVGYQWFYRFWAPGIPLPFGWTVAFNLADTVRSLRRPLQWGISSGHPGPGAGERLRLAMGADDITNVRQLLLQHGFYF